MPHIAAHSAIADPIIPASMISLAAIAHMLGIDFVALFYSFMGAVCWRAVQPRIDKRLDEITKAFGWALLGMILGTLGAVFVETLMVHWFPVLAKIGHAQLIGLPAVLLGFLCHPLILKSMTLLKEWKAKGDHHVE